MGKSTLAFLGKRHESIISTSNSGLNSRADWSFQPWLAASLREKKNFIYFPRSHDSSQIFKKKKKKKCVESLDCIRLEGIWHLKIIFYKYRKCMSALKISFCHPGHEGRKLYLPSIKCYFSNFLRIQEGCAELMWGLLNRVFLPIIFVHRVGFETHIIFSEEMTERETDRIGKNQAVLRTRMERKLWGVVISHIQNAHKKKSRLA